MWPNKDTELGQDMIGKLRYETSYIKQDHIEG